MGFQGEVKSRFEALWEKYGFSEVCNKSHSRKGEVAHLEECSADVTHDRLQSSFANSLARVSTPTNSNVSDPSRLSHMKLNGD